MNIQKQSRENLSQSEAAFCRVSAHVRTIGIVFRALLLPSSASFAAPECAWRSLSRGDASQAPIAYAVKNILIVLESRTV